MLVYKIYFLSMINRRHAWKMGRSDADLVFRPTPDGPANILNSLPWDIETCSAARLYKPSLRF